MKNKSKINGNQNVVIQGSNNQTTNSNKRNYALAGIIIALVALLVAIIVGWDNIVNFFNGG